MHDQPGTTAIRSIRPSRSAGASTCWSTPRACVAGAQSTRASSTCRPRWRASQIDRCDVAVLVVDAREAATPRTRAWPARSKPPGAARWSCSTRRTSSGAATSTEDRNHREALAFLAYAPVIVTSAVTRAGVTGIVTEATRIFGEASSACRPARSTSCSRTSSPAAAARRSRWPSRPPLLRDPGQRPPADVLRQHEPRRRHRPLLPPLPGQPVPEGLWLRGHARAPGLPRPRPEEARRQPPPRPRLKRDTKRARSR